MLAPATPTSPSASPRRTSRTLATRHDRSCLLVRVGEKAGGSVHVRDALFSLTWSRVDLTRLLEALLPEPEVHDGPRHWTW